MAKEFKDSIINKASLLNLGMKKALLDKLDDELISMLVVYSMDHSKASNLCQNLIILASMEIRGKKGAISLASNGIATIQQLKNISANEINEIYNLYTYSNDHEVAIKAVLQALIIGQQEKLYHHTDGVKGEYYLLRDEADAPVEKLSYRRPSTYH